MHLLTLFYNHPLIKYLGEDGKFRKPAYLKSETFSKVLIDLLKGNSLKPEDDPKPQIEDALKNGILNWNRSTNAAVPSEKSIPDDTLKFLNSIWVDAKGDVDKFKTMLENWFDETMDRVSGWYKKYSQFILLLIGLVIAIAFNVDTIKIVHELEKDPKLREQIVGQAQTFAKAHPNLDKELADAQIENQKQVDLTIPGCCDTGNAKIAKDTLLKQKNTKADAVYDSLTKRGQALEKQADILVQKDLNSIKKTVGIGYGSWGDQSLVKKKKSQKKDGTRRRV